jgi:hypothetical protein
MQQPLHNSTTQEVATAETNPTTEETAVSATPIATDFSTPTSRSTDSTSAEYKAPSATAQTNKERDSRNTWGEQTKTSARRRTRRKATKATTRTRRKATKVTKERNYKC